MCCAYSILILSGLKQLDPRKYFDSLGPVVVSAVWDSPPMAILGGVFGLGQAPPRSSDPIMYPVWGRLFVVGPVLLCI
jgi:hypothetical protein